MTAQITPSVVMKIPRCVSSFAEKKPYEGVNALVSSSITERSTQKEVDDVVSSIRDNNKLSLFSRLIDRFFNHSEKQNARDQMVTLTIVDAFQKNSAHLKSALEVEGRSKEEIGKITGDLSFAVAKSIEKMGYAQQDGVAFNSVEECAAYALHRLQQGTSLECASGFQDVWTLTNTKLGFVGTGKETVGMSATIYLSEENGGPLSFDIAVSDVNENDFALRYMASNAESHLVNKKEKYRSAVVEYDSALIKYKECNEKFLHAETKVNELKDKATETSIKVTEAVTQMFEVDVDKGILQVKINGMETESQGMEAVETLIHQLSEMGTELQDMETEVSQLRRLCVSTSSTAKSKAESMFECSHIYNREAQAFCRLGDFIERSATVSDASEGLQKTLDSVLQESGYSLEALSARQQRSAFKTFHFHRTSDEQQKYITEEHDKHHSASCMEKVATLTPSLLQDSRGTFRQYASNLGQAYQSWQQIHHSYMMHEVAVAKQVDDTKRILTSAVAVKDNVLGKYKAMNHCLMDLSSKPERSIQRNLVLAFAAAYETEAHEVAKQEVATAERDLRELMQHRGDKLTSENDSRVRLISAARPYGFVSSIKLGDEFSAAERAMVERSSRADDHLQSVTSVKQDSRSVSSVLHDVRQFEQDEHIMTVEHDKMGFASNIRDMHNITSIDAKIDKYIESVQSKQNEIAGDKVFDAIWLDPFKPAPKRSILTSMKR